MTLPNLTRKPKPKCTLKENIVMFSPATDIYYKNVKGILMKYPNYGGAERGWAESMYSGNFKHMKVATEKQIRELK